MSHVVETAVPGTGWSAQWSHSPTRHSDDATVSPSHPSAPIATFSHGPEEKIYYDDGNLDLVVGGVCFRVYRGVLAQHSPIFKDMFNPTEPSVDKIIATTIPTLSAYIRLGHKYQIWAIYAPAMAYLKRRFAPTLNGWKKWTSSRGEPYTLPRCTSAHAIGVVNLARLTGENALPPLAFLGCAQPGCRQLTDGFTYGDGQRETIAWRGPRRVLESDVARKRWPNRVHSLLPPQLPGPVPPDALIRAGGRLRPPVPQPRHAPGPLRSTAPRSPTSSASSPTTSTSGSTTASARPPRFADVHAIGVVDLARLTHEPALHPSAETCSAGALRGDDSGC
ncbi:uncharacterized protein BXZ73DRAFT_81021 [Epithele typhae]|uniref:uncharacterized protein n=1 Tax=Epithele typhae TaxID=378194 RepID=UPI00200726E2|nr:uncharacterized protein BXZ73DRAFT_81021 [Epithele typhae]KAH9916566.1 hypothetical protein BXZ73DRAFT_81021 [Epithele typhae]